MSRTVAEAKITTREQRKRLQVRSQPHWRSIDPEVHLGYRKGKRGGTWVVRRYVGGEDYRQKTFATADDELREGTLDYYRAEKRAKEIVEAMRREEQAAAEGPLLTVRDAIETYVAARNARDSARQGRDVRSDAAGRLGRHVVGKEARGKRKSIAAAPLSHIAMQDLAEGDLLNWRDGLAGKLKPATKQRLVNDLKAALNAAYAANRNRLPTTLPATIKYGLRALDAAEADQDAAVRDDQILGDAEIARLIGAAREIDTAGEWGGDLFRLITVLAATGARFSQVVRLRVRDVEAKNGRMFVPVSRKGGRGKSGSTPVPIGKDVLEVLLPAVSGRPKDALLLERWRKERVPGGIQWQRAGRGAWRGSSEMKRPWEAIRARAELPHAIAYALRYSSIVRGIRANLPIRLVAALHDTSVAMIERHYGRYIADGLDELAAKSVVPLVPAAETDNIVTLRGA